MGWLDIFRRNKNGADQGFQRAINPDLDGIEDYLSESSARYQAVGTLRKDAISEAEATIGTTTPDRLEELEQAYNSALWVYAAIYQIAVNLSRVPLRAYLETGGEREDRPDSPLQMLIDRPSGPDGVLSCNAYIQRWVTNLESTGTSLVFVNRVHEDPRNAAGNIRSLRPLRTSRVDIKPGGDFVELYKYTANQSAIEIVPGNIVFSRFEDPTNDYWGQSPITVVKRTVNIDQRIEEYNEATLKRGGVPEVVLSTPNPLTPAQARRTKQDWLNRFGSYKRAGGVMVASDGLEAKPLGFAPKDMQWLDLHRVSARRIFAAFGVPPALMMSFEEASVLANADAQRKIFYENTLQPLGDLFEDAHNYIFQRSFGPGWGVRFAWEKVDILTEDDDAERANVREDFRSSMITLNEARKETGRDELDGDERGDMYFHEINPTGPSLLTLSATPQAKPAEAVSTPKAPNEVMKRLAVVSFRRLNDKWEPRLEDATKQAFEDQKGRVLANFNTLTGKQVEEDSPFEGFVSTLFNTDLEIDEFFKALQPAFLGSIVDAATLRLQELFGPDTTLEIDSNNTSIRAFMEKWSATRIVRIQDETRRQISALVQNSFDEGESEFELRNRLVQLFDHYNAPPVGTDPGIETRAKRVARTEVATGLNRGKYEGAQRAQESGVQVVKSWITVGDGFVRASHIAQERSTSASPIPLDQRFDNGLLHPGDTDGPASETINCRCTMVEQILEDIPT